MVRPAPSLFDTMREAPSREATMRARTPVDDLLGVCRVCGDPNAGHGFGVFLRRGIVGRWACKLHRAEVEAMPE